MFPVLVRHLIDKLGYVLVVTASHANVVQHQVGNPHLWIHHPLRLHIRLLRRYPAWGMEC